jgi:hypothetical protein
MEVGFDAIMRKEVCIFVLGFSFGRLSLLVVFLFERYLVDQVLKYTDLGKLSVKS